MGKVFVLNMQNAHHTENKLINKRNDVVNFRKKRNDVVNWLNHIIALLPKEHKN